MRCESPFRGYILILARPWLTYYITPVCSYDAPNQWLSESSTFVQNTPFPIENRTFRSSKFQFGHVILIYCHGMWWNKFSCEACLNAAIWGYFQEYFRNFQNFVEFHLLCDFNVSWKGMVHTYTHGTHFCLFLEGHLACIGKELIVQWIILYRGHVTQILSDRSKFFCHVPPSPKTECPKNFSLWDANLLSGGTF